MTFPAKSTDAYLLGLEAGATGQFKTPDEAWPFYAAVQGQRPVAWEFRQGFNDAIKRVRREGVPGSMRGWPQPF